jgi:hypothetical protein
VLKENDGERCSRLLLVPVASACLCLLLSGCADSGGPNDLPDPFQLAVVVRVDSATFRSAGEFTLDLVPSDHGGRTYFTEPWTITTTLSTPLTASVDQLSQEVEPADSQPIATAILIDDSGSMRASDPDRIRAVAAQLFWRDLLPGRPGNIVALLDFGRGSVEPSPTEYARSPRGWVPRPRRGRHISQPVAPAGALRLDQVPTQGTSARGEMALSGERGNLSAEWSLVAP